jgi:hypothetical protein
MEILETFIASFFFALIFLFGSKLEGPLGFPQAGVAEFLRSFRSRS